MGIKLLPRRIIGQTIRGIRTRLGMSPAEFAKSLGAEDAAEVEKWERGTVQPDYGTLAKIAAMGMVDALVFHEQQPDGPQPQLTPGEATELNEILARMEALLTEARAVVNRATERTAVELLEAATASPPAQSVETSLLLDAEVRMEATPRTRSRTASAGRRAASTSRARTPRNSGSAGGGSTSSGSSGSTSTSGGSRSSSSRSGGGGSKSSSSGNSSGGTPGTSS
ncbi:MAG TPA: helix-turn-helix transcriptional regulator [Longimicrobium sp.]|jgi:transcriptional regulator with XRE-family HTH domain